MNIQTEVRAWAGKWIVFIHEYKFNIVRQESYWATRKGTTKIFKNKATAERYAASFK